MKNALSILKDIFNYNQFRGNQEKIVNSVISGNNALILMVEIQEVRRIGY